MRLFLLAVELDRSNLIFFVALANLLFRIERWRYRNEYELH